MCKSVTLCSLIVLTCAAVVSGQSTFDLEPQLQANPESSEFTMSSDPDQLPVFRFATAQMDSKGNIVIATSRARQKLVAPLSGNVDPELDPKGILYTENVMQNYTVSVPYTEKDEDGNLITKIRTETRTRSVPVTRYRKRNEDEQEAFDEKMAEHKAKMKSGEIEAPKVMPAVATTVAQEYQTQVPYTVVEDGKKVTRTRVETRTRTVSVYRGQTETTMSVNSTKMALDKVTCYSVDGKELTEAIIKERLSERKPVFLVSSADASSFEYFIYLLKEDSIFVVVNK